VPLQKIRRRLRPHVPRGRPARPPRRGANLNLRQGLGPAALIAGVLANPEKAPCRTAWLGPRELLMYLPADAPGRLVSRKSPMSAPGSPDPRWRPSSSHAQSTSGRQNCGTRFERVGRLKTRHRTKRPTIPGPDLLYQRRGSCGRRRLVLNDQALGGPAGADLQDRDAPGWTALGVDNVADGATDKERILFFAASPNVRNRGRA